MTNTQHDAKPRFESQPINTSVTVLALLAI
jgi:hypothetical protein